MSGSCGRGVVWGGVISLGLLGDTDLVFLVFLVYYIKSFSCYIFDYRRVSLNQGKKVKLTSYASCAG